LSSVLWVIAHTKLHQSVHSIMCWNTLGHHNLGHHMKASEVCLVGRAVE
jgi:hypothetical protein